MRTPPLPPHDALPAQLAADTWYRRPAWLRYGLALLLVALAAAVTIVFESWLFRAPLAPFYAAVALVAWYCGPRPALLSIGVSLVAIDIWATFPVGLWSINWDDIHLFVAFLVVSLLITALSASRDLAEAALRASERRFRAMLETANEGVWLIDREARTQYANDRMADLLGTTPAQVATGTVLDFVFPDDVPTARERIGANLAGHGEVFDFRFRRADGEEILVLAGTSPVRDGTGKVAGALGLFTDVTARRRAESELARANERFTLALDAVQALVYEWDVTSGTVERSAGLLGLLGYRPDEVPPNQDWWYEQIHSDDRERIAGESIHALPDVDRYTREYRIRHRDGRWMTVWDQGLVVRDPSGRIVRVVGSTIDITARTEAEHALRLLEEAGKALASSLDYEATLQRVAWVAVPELADWCVVDLVDGSGEARRVAVAHADPGQADLAAQLMRYRPSASGEGPEEGVIRTGEPLLIERVTEDALRTAAQSEAQRDLLRAFSVVSAIVVPLRAGGQIHGAMTLATTSFSNRQLDRDDLALAEQLGRRSAVAIQNARLYREAQEAEDRYRGLFEGTKDGMLVVDPQGACVDVNPALGEMTGYNRDELVGVPVTHVAPNGPWSGEQGKRLRRDGQWRGEFELRAKDGSLLPVESWITRVRLPIGQVYVGVLRDVSERKQFERLQEEFLSALAHDLKNPLTAVRGQTQLLRRRIDRGDMTDMARLAAGLKASIRQRRAWQNSSTSSPMSCGCAPVRTSSCNGSRSTSWPWPAAPSRSTSGSPKSTPSASRRS